MTINAIMPMVKVLQAISVNKFIYYFKRIPLIGKMLPDASYSFGDIKAVITVIGTIFKALVQLFSKSLYIGIVAFLPFTILPSYVDKSASFVTIMVFLSMFIGMFNSDKILQNSFEKYTCIKLMRMPSRQYLLSLCLVNQVVTFLAFLLPMMILGALAGVAIPKSILLTLMIVMAHTIGEALNLKVFTRIKKVLAQNVLFMLITVVVGAALAYVPIYFAVAQIPIWEDTALIVSRVVISIPVVLVEIILFVLSVKYIVSYKNYTWVASKTINAEQLATLQNPSSANASARFRDVKIDVEKDFTSSITSPKFSNKKGYAYLNALFFERHKRMLAKPVELTLLIIVALTLIVVSLTIIFHSQLASAMTGITQTLPFFVFIMYMITSFTSEKACRAMFNNCDISLLRYSFYREPKDILQNFWIRFKMICKMNLIISAALCIMVGAIAGAAGAQWDIMDEALFMLSILCLGLFFSVHHLFLYYVFQPYTTDLGMKNPIFTAINTSVYMLCFMCLQIDSTPKSFTLVVIAATIVYMSVALILVRKLAPKNFRVK